jgi:hypothetical protein
MTGSDRTAKSSKETFELKKELSWEMSFKKYIQYLQELTKNPRHAD